MAATNKPSVADRTRPIATGAAVVGAYFLAEGVATIMYALEHRQQLSGRWEWMLISGIVDLALAVMIFIDLPGSAAWALGLLVGINMIFGGTALLMMALHARKSA